MSQIISTDDFDSPPVRGNNNPAPRSSQSKSQLLETMTRNIPKLKELNYTQWKNVLTNSIKKAKLWGYVDGSIVEPPEHDAGHLATYYDEATAVRNAILGSLEPGAQRYIEDALDPKDAWLVLEKKYLTAEVETDAGLVAIEERLAGLRLEQGGDIIEHLAEFCRMRSQLNGTRLALDDQASVSMLYRSLPLKFRQLALSTEKTEIKDFSALCVQLSDLSQHPDVQVTANDSPKDYTNWGVPDDIMTFGLSGDKNSQLAERAADTCRDCLLKGHKAGTEECPQYNWRRELWGKYAIEELSGTGNSSSDIVVNTKRLSYEFSEPTKVILKFDELGLKPELQTALSESISGPSAIQQCAILPITCGRNVFALAPSNNGKTTALAISILQAIDTTLAYPQALVIAPTSEASAMFQKAVRRLGSRLSAECYSLSSSDSLVAPNLALLTKINKNHIFVGTPAYLLGLIRRSIINVRKLKTVALDDLDKMVESGAEEQIFEICRYAPSLAQLVATSTVCSSSMEKVSTKLLADPLKILVQQNEGMSIGIHFFVKVPTAEKTKVLSTLFSEFGVNGFVVLCNDSEADDISRRCQPRGHRNYCLTASISDDDKRNMVMNEFIFCLSQIRIHTSGWYDSSSRVTVQTSSLVITDVSSLSAPELLDVGLPLINYCVPSDAKDYIKRLDLWRIVDPERKQMIITFIATDTDEINVIRDLQQCYGVHIAELLWNGSFY
ncbi:ATP-dependent RNA helicase FAL1 OS=Ustilago maydis (strain 521 / FGSC 9021) GN=FAL1 PE=3 SV=1 [Rhizoctonia solani AG-1 IB]|uniref:ATP-dependent RNA helicase FAL1 n=1 Tax=Thanatephorus cucumeris (strain AG1-IB / isolate 7/3/14) TaxID=1108050 RepID=A0A0B7G5Y3_THACB|nr:ATP-dependent RNA helicase FAL1 OS=Ustilago maydis (strain 521 / FGSC 9021) GN=FAL1 PE=3 SV=1 [Rhizoctonia solani AG-1 IB]